MSDIVIKDAIYSWWTNPLAVNSAEGQATYLAYVDAKGAMGIMAIDAESGEQVRTELAQFEQDDHNAPAVQRMADGRIVVFYARHNMDQLLRYRVSKRPYDISEFGEEKSIESSASVTYIQALQTGSEELTVLWRSGSSRWCRARFSLAGEGGFVTAEEVWLDAGEGLYYVQSVLDPEGEIRLFMYGHPKGAEALNVVRHGALPDAGQALPLSPEDYEVAFRPRKGYRVRLLDTAQGVAPRIAVTEFQGTDEAVYREIYHDGQGFTSRTLCPAGLPIEEPAGGNYYHGGVSFAKADDRRLYLAREQAGRWSVERWVLAEERWVQAEVLSEGEQKRFRPYALLGARAGRALAYVQGHYTAYTAYEADIHLK